MVLDLLVDALETVVAELEELSASLYVLHCLLADIGHEDVSKELQTDSMIVLHHFVTRVLHVLRSRVADNADLDQLPMLGQNVLRLDLLQDQKPEQVDQCDLAFFFCDFCQLGQFVDCVS